MSEKRKLSDKESSNGDSDRRRFLKRTAVVAGGATLGSFALYEIFKPNLTTGSSPTLSNKTLSADALIGYGHLGPEGEITLQRDSVGNISEITYGPMTIQVNRDSQGSVTSVQTTLSSDSIKVVDTINRNPEGGISGVSRKWPSL